MSSGAASVDRAPVHYCEDLGCDFGGAVVCGLPIYAGGPILDYTNDPERVTCPACIGAMTGEFADVGDAWDAGYRAGHLAGYLAGYGDGLAAFWPREEGAA